MGTFPILLFIFLNPVSVVTLYLLNNHNGPHFLLHPSVIISTHTLKFPKGRDRPALSWYPDAQ